MEYSLKNWLNEIVQVYPYLSQDGAGDPVTAAPIDIRCYMEGGLRLIIDRRGEEVNSSNVLYVDGADAEHLKDFVHIGTRKYPILSIIPYYNERGIVEMLEVFL